MTKVSTRAGSLGPSATNAVAARARALRDSGIDVIDFSRGELDLAPPVEVVEAVVRSAGECHVHQYGSVAGLPRLRELVAARHRFAPDQVLIANGTKSALWLAILALVDPGDEVLLPCPYWTSYPTMIELAGGRVVPVPSSPEQSYKVTPADLERCRSERTTVMVYVSPANPSGAVYTDAEARAIGDWALEHGIAVISDDIYADIVYPPHTYTPITEVVPELADLCLYAGGVGKSFAMTGWRIGWLTGPRELIAKAEALQSHTSGHPANISQIAAVAALTADGDWLKHTMSTLAQRRDVFLEGIGEVLGMACVEPAGGFYAFVDVSALRGRQIGGRTVGSSKDLAEILIDEARVVTVPGEAFGTPDHLRFSFALEPNVIRRGLDRLSEVLSGRRGGGRHVSR